MNRKKNVHVHKLYNNFNVYLHNLKICNYKLQSNRRIAILVVRRESDYGAKKDLLGLRMVRNGNVSTINIVTFTVKLFTHQNTCDQNLFLDLKGLKRADDVFYILSVLLGSL